MAQYTPDFNLEVEGIKGVCPAGEVYAKQTIAEKKIPVFSCEGPCIRGDIARLAANMVARDVPSFARACHAETFLVPHSSMTRWVKGAEKAIMIDGCFLMCHGRILRKLIGEDKVVQIDAFPLYKKYADIFSMDDVPEEERKAVARQVADKIIAILKQDKRLEGAVHGTAKSRITFSLPSAGAFGLPSHRRCSIAHMKSSSKIFSRVEMSAIGPKQT